MPNEDKIVDQVDSILNPSITTHIEHYSTFDDVKKYENILLELCISAKKCYWVSDLSPYILIKDDKENYLYNDVLHLSKHGIPFPITETDSDFYLDIILDSNKPENVYTVLSFFHTKRKKINRTLYKIKLSKLKGSPKTLTVNHCNDIANSLLQIDAKRRNRKKPINKDGSISMNLLVHKYNPSKKTWTFQLPNTL